MYSSNGKTYLIVDGENIDTTLGLPVLERRPNPEERPRRDRILEGARRVLDEEARELLSPSGSSGAPLMGFVQALIAIDCIVIPLSGPEDVRVVDVDLRRTMEATGELESGDVILTSHDADFAPRVEYLLDLGRNVAIMRFREFLVPGLHELGEKSLKVTDLEYDARAFRVTLPRLHIIDVSDFNPSDFLRSSSGVAQVDALRVSVVAASVLHAVFVRQSPQGGGSDQSTLVRLSVYSPAYEYAYRDSSDREPDLKAFHPQPTYNHASRGFSDRLKEYPPRSTARSRPLEWTEV